MGQLSRTAETQLVCKCRQPLTQDTARYTSIYIFFSAMIVLYPLLCNHDDEGPLTNDFTLSYDHFNCLSR